MLAISTSKGPRILPLQPRWLLARLKTSFLARDSCVQPTAYVQDIIDDCIFNIPRLQLFCSCQISLQSMDDCRVYTLYLWNSSILCCGLFHRNIASSLKCTALGVLHSPLLDGPLSCSTCHIQPPRGNNNWSKYKLTVCLTRWHILLFLAACCLVRLLDNGAN